MSTLLLHGIAAGLVLAAACGDAGKETAQARRSDAGRAAKAVAQADACALLTKAEAEAILGKSIGEPAKGGRGECHYEAAGGAGEIVVYPMTLGFGSKEEFHAFVKEDTEAMNARTQKGLEKMGATIPPTAVEPVPQVGDAAYYVDPSLIVLSQGRVLNITAADRSQAVAVAGKALPRFQ